MLENILLAIFILFAFHFLLYAFFGIYRAPETVLYHTGANYGTKGETYAFIRWNYWAVIGMSRAGDAVVQRIRLLPLGYCKALSGEFHDESNDYKLACGKGIRPPDSLTR